jgi:DUF4097 and DUF4098 domain-containing protein YvlB
MNTSISAGVLVRSAAVAAVTLVLLAPTAEAQRKEGSFDRTLKVSGAVQLTVRSGSGQIRVNPGAPGTVRVVARIQGNDWIFAAGDLEQRIRAIEQNPPITQQGNAIQIGTFADESMTRDISISYDVTVPAETKLAAKTGSGGIEVGSIQGPLDASSGSGSIDVGRVGGAVTVSAGSGSISVDGAGSLNARTGSGSIKATNVAGPTSANSGSGSIRVDQAGKGDVDLSAGSGSISVSGVDGALRVSSASGGATVQGRPAGTWSLRSASGGITVTLPADAAFTLDATANSGPVETVHPVTMSGRIDRHQIRGTVRGGGPLVDIRTSSGGIRIQ